MFGSMLGLWGIQPLGSGTPGSVMARVSGWTSHWLATPIISVPPLPSTFHREERLSEGYKAGLVSTGNLALSQEISLQGTYTLLLGVLAKVILLYSWEFP